MSTSTYVNEAVVEIADDWRDETLLSFLNNKLGLTGAKFGCGVGLCGACTVGVNGNATKACLVQMSKLAGARIRTIEGLATPAGLHPVQSAWLSEAVAQCGYCQAGQIMAAVVLLEKNPSPNNAQIDAALDGNLCRCGTYPRIRKAIQVAAAARIGNK